MPKFMKLFLSGPEKGARTSVYLASSAEVEGTSGEYFMGGKQAKASAASKDQAVTDKLWNISCEMIGLPESLGDAESAAA